MYTSNLSAYSLAVESVGRPSRFRARSGSGHRERYNIRLPLFNCIRLLNYKNRITIGLSTAGSPWYLGSHHDDILRYVHIEVPPNWAQPRPLSEVKPTGNERGIVSPASVEQELRIALFQFILSALPLLCGRGLVGNSQQASFAAFAFVLYLGMLRNRLFDEEHIEACLKVKCLERSFTEARFRWQRRQRLSGTLFMEIESLRGKPT